MENRLRSRGCIAEAGYKTWKEEEQTGMAEQRVEAPRANVDVDVKALPIGPEEAFVLSRVDGYASVLAISHSTGLAKERVQEILERLEALGAVHSSDTGLSGSRADAQRIDPQHVDSNRNNTSLAPSPHGFDEKPHAEGSPQRPSPARSTPSAQGPGFNVVPDIDLTADEQAEIWRAWSRIDQVDYYELLGVPRDASREVIREAYFARVASVHPDKHFGRRLGSYKQKLETLFQHLTTAHETLARRRKRQVYDATLPSARPQARETSLPPPPASAAPTKSNGVSTAQRAAASTRTSVRPDVSAASAQGNVPIPIAPEAERRLAAQRALERGLRSVSISPSLRAGRPSAAPPPPARPEVRPTVSAV